MHFLKPLCIGSLAAGLALTACNRPAPAPSENAPAPSQPAETSPSPSQPSQGVPERPAAPKSSAAPTAKTAPPPKEIWKEFSGDKAMEEVRKQTELGPRPSGSPEVDKARALITEKLRSYGWDVQRDEFTDDTPHGATRFANLIARFSANGAHPAQANAQEAIVCSHYDTKIFSTIRFVGASDGASSTGALVELARVLAMNPALAAKVELVFFDGEEAVQQFTETDGLYGSRHYAKTLRESGRAAQFKFGILWDMIGDRDLTITLPPDSPSELASAIFSAADALGKRQNFSFFDRSILDDHTPLNGIARIPAIDLIDFKYPYWHTADDTLDKLAPESLQTVGAVTLYQLSKAFVR